MSQQIGWSVEAKLLYEIKQLTKSLASRSYIQTFPNFASFPTPGITGTLYVDEATGDIYVWNGTSYVLLSSGITALNGLIAAAQLLVTGSTGTDFNISSVGTTHTFNIPTASATNRGLLSSADWTTFNNKPSGTGTTNYVSKFTGASTLGNSQIFDNGTNVGIGTTTPAQKLEVNGSAIVTGFGSFGRSVDGTVRLIVRGQGTTSATYGLTVQDPNGVNLLVVRDDGNVGIGTASPSARLENYTSIGTKPTLGDATQNYTIISGDTRTGTTSISSSFATTLVLASNTDTIAAGTGASIGFQGKWNSSLYTSQAQFASIFGGKENATDANLAGYLSFATRPAGGNPTERARITSAGELLIGSSVDAGAYALQVAGSIYNTTGAVFAASSGEVLIGTTTDAGAYALQVAGSIYNTTGAVFAASSGEVLINTITDVGDYRLQVNGNANFRDDVLIDTNLRVNRHIALDQTLAAWSLGNAIQGPQNATLFVAGGGVQTLANVYYDGSYKYTTSNPGAAMFLLQSGITFATYGSGTANGALTGANEMVYAGGELRVGISDQGAFKLQVADKSYFGDEVQIASTTDLGNYKLQVTGEAIITAGIRTDAPSGGTAATWKLGTVATVSPTSPNRTIEVEIGGTTYYIHAKTTNN